MCQYTALTYPFPNFEPVHCSMFISNFCFLTTYRFLRRQIMWSGIPISKNFLQFVVIHTVKGFSLVNEAEVGVFLKFPCFFCDPMDIGNLISGSSAFSKFSLYIWTFLVHVLMKPSLENLKHYLASMWNACSCAVVWTFFAITLIWYWNESWPFVIYSGMLHIHYIYIPLYITYISNKNLLYSGKELYSVSCINL